jgi:hypothetical protein
VVWREIERIREKQRICYEGKRQVLEKERNERGKNARKRKSEREKRRVISGGKEEEYEDEGNED